MKKALIIIGLLTFTYVNYFIIGQQYRNLEKVDLLLEELDQREWDYSDGLLCVENEEKCYYLVEVLEKIQ